ncbi:N-acetyltransferase [Candidatus Thorarchaeota archaeon]|nr:MAG: N-acetyltransferase [Candidatus Thorarchaeota archaeon]
MENHKVRLKDEREVILRLLEISDRDRLVHLFSTMSDKALEWGMPPYSEITIDRWLSNLERLIPLVALFQDRIVGYAAIFKHVHFRERGVADLGIYLHQDFHGVGLGTVMSETLLSIAEEQGLHRICLHVVEDNRAAVSLYRKLGFVVEGTMRDAYYGADNTYHNMLVMGIVFPKN